MPKKSILLAAALAAGLAGSASAQQQPAPAQSGDAPAQTTVHSINVVDIKELPSEVQAKVNDVIAHRSDADLQKLRDSIDAAPPVKSALAAKGLTSKMVVAASLGKDGSLTLITKKPG